MGFRVKSDLQTQEGPKKKGVRCTLAGMLGSISRMLLLCVVCDEKTNVF